MASTLFAIACSLGVTSLAQETPAPTGPNIEPVDFAATSVAQADPAAAPVGGAWGFVVFSPNGKLIATVSVPEGDGPKGEVYVWTVADSKPICHFEQTGRIQAVAFSPDSSLIAIGPDGPQAGVKLIETAKGELKQTLPGPAARANCLAWSADGKQLALGSTFDKTVRVWDVEKKKFTKAHEVELSTIWAVAFAKDGAVLAAGTPARDRDELVVLDVTTGKPVQTLKGHKEAVEAAHFSADASVLTSACYGATVRVWNLADGTETAALKGHKRGIRAVAMSADGKRIASANDREFKLWDGEKKESLGDLGGENAGAKFLAMSPDGLWLVSTARDGKATVWDVEKKSEKATLDKTPMAVASTEVKNGDAEEKPATPPPTDAPEPEAIQSLAYSPDGKWLAIAREDGRISIRTAEDGKVHRQLEAFADVASCVAFSPDSQLLAAGSFEKTIKIWKVVSGEQVAELTGHANWVFSVAFSKDGGTLASASYDKTVRLWNVAEAKEIAVLPGHTAGVRAVAFTRDGLHLISAGADRTAIVWRLSDNQEVTRLKGHTAAV
ncbi:MAG: WD40 repeat domain-containing protein, partial [Candidatus Saccharimonas sp.]|nr:WD40 repeat domain-containing protein [Planctomycetaceae bacterium]